MDRHQPNTADITTNATEAGVFKKIGNVLRRPEGKAIEAALVMGIGLSALTACAPEEAPKPTTTQSQETSEPEPDESSSPEQDLEEQVASIEIPVNLTDTELAVAFLDRTDNWWNAGATDELLDESLKANLSWDEFLPKVAERNAQVYALALFGENWQSNPDVRTLATNMTNGNRNLLQNYTATAWSDNPENILAYTAWTQLSSVEVIESTGATRTLKITYTNHDNSEKNFVDDNTLPPIEVVTVSFTNTGESEIITKFSVG